MRAQREHIIKRLRKACEALKRQAGDQIEVRTNYGTYTYEVTGSKTTRYDDTAAYDLTKNEDNLILYTCHRVAGVGATPYRVFVYAKYVSGPKIVS